MNIPVGWEQCSYNDVEAVLVNGRVYDDTTMLRNGYLAVVIMGTPIPSNAWSTLGMVPVRRTPPPKPVEFVAGEPFLHATHFVDNHGHESPRGFYVMQVPEGVKKGMKFREVQECPD